MPVCSSPHFPLLLTIVVTRHEPHRPNQIQSHAFTIISHSNHGVSPSVKIQSHNNFISVRVIGVLDQLEDGQTCAADQFVAKQLQHSGPGPERLAYFPWSSIAQRRFFPEVPDVRMSGLIRVNTPKMLQLNCFILSQLLVALNNRGAKMK